MPKITVQNTEYNGPSKKIKMAPGNPCSKLELSGASAFVLFLSRTFGLAPFNFRRSSGCFRWTVEPSNVAHLYSWIVCLTLSCMTGWGSYKEILFLARTQSGFKAIQTFVLAVDDLVLILMAMVAVVTAPKRVRSIMRVFGILHEVDLVLGKSTFQAADRRSLHFYTIGYVIAILMLAYTYYMERDDADVHPTEIFLDYFTYYLQYMILTVMEMHFMCIVKALQMRYHALANALQDEKLHKNVHEISYVSELFGFYELAVATSTVFARIKENTSNDPKYDGLIHSLPRHMRVSKIADLRLRLLDAIHTTCEGFGHLLLIILISALVHLIDVPYFLIVDISAESEELRPCNVIQELSYFSWAFVRLILLVEPCHQCILAEGRIAMLLCQIADSEEDLLTRRELKRLWRHLAGGSTVAFPVLSVCTIDRGLITAITGTVTTYLVILIQFQNQK